MNICFLKEKMAVHEGILLSTLLLKSEIHLEKYKTKLNVGGISLMRDVSDKMRKEHE